MAHIWDYDEKELKKSKWGKLLILERQINYGITRTDKEKLNLKLIKENWQRLNIEPIRRRFLELMIWGK